MPQPVKLSDILDALDSQGDQTHYWVDRETGHVEMLTDEFLHIAGDDRDQDSDHPEWMRALIELARRIEAEPERFAELPDRFEIDEWSLMEDFSRTIADPAIAHDLDRAIHGQGAFRRFKSALDRNDLWPAWNAFKQAALLSLARARCEQNQLSCIDDTRLAENQ